MAVLSYLLVPQTSMFEVRARLTRAARLIEDLQRALVASFGTLQWETTTSGPVHDGDGEVDDDVNVVAPYAVNRRAMAVDLAPRLKHAHRNMLETRVALALLPWEPWTVKERARATAAASVTEQLVRVLKFAAEVVPTFSQSAALRAFAARIPAPLAAFQVRKGLQKLFIATYLLATDRPKSRAHWASFWRPVSRARCLLWSC